MGSGVELKDYWHAISDGWKFIVAAVVAALACGIAYLTTQSTVYTSTTQLYVSALAESEDPEELYQRNAIAAQRVASYVEVLNGDSLADQVAEDLGSAVSPTGVQVNVVPNTVVLEVSAVDADPDRAREVAAAYAAAAPGVIEQLENREGAGSQVELSVIDEADPGSPSGSRSPTLVLILCVMLGLGAGVVIASLWWALRRELASEDRSQINPVEDK